MGKTIFLTGGTGVIGRSLIPQLRDAGHLVTGMTRTSGGKTILQAAGIQAVIVDIFDGDALKHAVKLAEPEIVIHQVTDLAGGIDPAAPEEGVKRNARIRREGTRNLVDAARATGVRRIIAQSIAWCYAPKDTPCEETDPLDIEATGPRAISVSQGIVPLEDAVLEQQDFEGLVLRYGQLYGPETWSHEPNGAAPVHVEAAAYAAYLAVEHGRHGAYNIANPGGSVVIDKALAELGWRPDFRLQQRE